MNNDRVFERAILDWLEEGPDRTPPAAVDAVLLATNHTSINYQELADWAPCVIDTRNAMAAIKTEPNQVWKSHVFINNMHRVHCASRLQLG